MAEQDYVHMPALEEYAERFARFFKFKRSGRRHPRGPDAHL